MLTIVHKALECSSHIVRLERLSSITENFMLQEILDLYEDEEFLTADGFDSAIIGVDEHSMRLIYSVSKCIDILVTDGMDYEDAIEYLNFNTFNAYVGEKTPIWCCDHFG